VTANHTAEEAFQHEEIGSKTYAHIERERRIKASLAELTPISNSASKLEPSDLIGTVPLLNGLSMDILKKLTGHAKAVTFLTNNIILVMVNEVMLCTLSLTGQWLYQE